MTIKIYAEEMYMASTGINERYYGLFAGGTPCTRAETIVYLWKNAGMPDAEQANQFLDIENHQSELGKAVSWAYVNSITGGTSANAFSPNNTCTRGQIVTFLYRAFK